MMAASPGSDRRPRRVSGEDETERCAAVAGEPTCTGCGRERRDEGPGAHGGQQHRRGVRRTSKAVASVR